MTVTLYLLRSAPGACYCLHMTNTATVTPATWNVGDAVQVAEGHNSNDVKRTDVPARIVGCSGMVVVVERTDPGRYHGEGLWAFASNLSPLA